MVLLVARGMRAERPWEGEPGCRFMGGYEDRMNGLVAGLAEWLAVEYPDTAPIAVGLLVAECAEEFPDDDPLFLEQACRARMAVLRAGRPAGRVPSSPERRPEIAGGRSRRRAR